MIKTSTRNTLLFLAAVAIFFLVTFPRVPMILDSAEVVLQSFIVGVMHPPGYPFEVLFSALFIHGLPFLSPVTAAGIAHIVLGLSTLAMVVLLACEVAGAWGYAVGLSLACAPLFWQYAVTPEVFIGLQFFAVCYIWLLHRPSLYKKPLFVLVLALAVLHHHTVILFLPVLIWAAYRERRNLRAHGVALLCGAICLSGYGLLFWMHPDGIYSWGNIQNFKSLLHHFLRSEYGTFSLARSEGATTLLERSWLAGMTVLKNSIFPLGVIAAMSIWRRKAAWGFFQYFLTTLLLGYLCVFTWTGSVPFTAAGIEVYKRFFLMPVVMLHSLAASMLVRSVPRKMGQGLVALLLGAFLLGQMEIWEDVLSGRREMAAQFHKDFLRVLPANAVINVQGDSSYFATTYYQGAEGMRPDVLIVPFSVLRWKYDKLKAHYPDVLVDSYRGSTPVPLMTFNRPFLEFGSRLTVSPEFTIVKREFTQQIYPGEHKLVFACDPVGPTYSGPDYPLRDYYFQSTLANNYGMCNFLKGLHQLKRGLDEPALASFEAALKKNPWLIYAQERLCAVLQSLKRDTSACQQRLELLLEHTHERFYLRSNFPLAPNDLKIEWEPENAN